MMGTYLWEVVYAIMLFRLCRTANSINTCIVHMHDALSYGKIYK